MKQVIFLMILAFLFGGCAVKNTQQEDDQKVDAATYQEDMEPKRMLPQHADLAQQVSRAIIKTNKGDITVEFYADDSPVTVNNFLNLAQDGFYDNTKFHRVIKDFMIQAGDPLTKEENTAVYGTGGPDYRFEDEINERPLVRGSLAMANAGPNTNGSQFFIVTAESTPWLDGMHTNFGYVVEGMDVVDAIEQAQTNERDLPEEDIIIESIELVEQS